MIAKHVGMTYSQCGCLEGTIYKCNGKYCRTVDQCCREIIDVSFTFEEWLFFRRVVDYAMLEASNGRAISSL